jgi:hypothetical protein
VKVHEACRDMLPHPFITACLIGHTARHLVDTLQPCAGAGPGLLKSLGALPDFLCDLDHLKLHHEVVL